MENDAPKSLGVCLSGGGFRASNFDLGVLRYLAEAGQLSKVTTISTVSGGSIFGAFVACRWDKIAGGQHSLEAYDEFVANPWREILTTRNLRNRWFVRSILRLPQLLSPTYTRGDVLADVFDDHLYEGRLMPDLPGGLDLVINAASLATGRAFRFHRAFLGEHTLGYTSYHDNPVRVADAVTASSAAPGILPPVHLDPHLYDFPSSAGDGLWLADGGVYDNLGLEWFLNWDRKLRPPGITRPPFIIVAEASGMLRTEWRGYRMVPLLRRAQSIMYEQSRSVRKRWFIDRIRAKKDAGSIFSINKVASRLKEATPELSAHSLPSSLVDRVAGIRTDLDNFLPEEVELLSYHGYRLAHVYLSTFAPQLAVEKPAWELDLSPESVRRYEDALAQSDERVLFRGRLW